MTRRSGSCECYGEEQDWTGKADKKVLQGELQCYVGEQDRGVITEKVASGQRLEETGTLSPEES